jgi:hypothetical protein
MDYKNIYTQFINDRRVKEKSLTGYTEKHHILPRSLGGDNSPENLIRLTAEDHTHAHLLLAKIYGGRMWYPIKKLVSTLNGRIPTKRMIKIAALARGKYKHDDEIKKKISESNKGKKSSDETKKKLSLARAGKPRSWVYTEKNKINLSNALKGKKKTPEAAANAVAARAGFKHKEETKMQMSKSRSGAGNARAVKISCKTNGMVFDCTKDAADFFGFVQSSLRCALNRGNGFFGGYQFEKIN